MCLFPRLVFFALVFMLGFAVLFRFICYFLKYSVGSVGALLPATNNDTNNGGRSWGVGEGPTLPDLHINSHLLTGKRQVYLPLDLSAFFSLFVCLFVCCSVRLASPSLFTRGPFTLSLSGVNLFFSRWMNIQTTGTKRELIARKSSSAEFLRLEY